MFIGKIHELNKFIRKGHLFYTKEEIQNEYKIKGAYTNINLKNRGLLDASSAYKRLFINKLYIRNGRNNLIDMYGIDNLGLKTFRRYSLRYNLYSYVNKKREEYNIEKGKIYYSSGGIFKGIVWLERECWDLYGICFTNSVDLRRLLTDYSFTGFPLRKDYPVVGYYELEYNLEFEELIYVPVSLNQENRFFLFDKKW